MTRRRGARRLPRWVLAVLAALALLGVAPLSGLGREPKVRRVERGAGEGPLRAGAGTADVAMPLPVPAVGYGLVRPEAPHYAGLA